MKFLEDIWPVALVLLAAVLMMGVGAMNSKSSGPTLWEMLARAGQQEEHQ